MQHYLSRILEPKVNGPETASLLVNLLKVKLSDSTLKKEIEEHPEYPSLLSISDVLNKYGIDNLGIKFDNEKFSEIPTPFITQIKHEVRPTNLFTVVKENGDNVVFFDPEKKRWNKLNKNAFLKRCSGIALLAEANDNAGEKDYKIKIKEERQKRATQYFSVGGVPALFIIVCLAGFMQSGISALLPFIFSLLTLAGCLSGVLLLWYELDQYNPLIRKICSAGKKTNCSAVLHSKASKIAGISWSVIGFTYFAGMLLLLLFSGLTNLSVLSVLSWINVLALPYTIFSIYYQWRIAKQWCILCLSVQTLLVLQAVIAFTGGWHNVVSFNSIDVGLIAKVIVSFSVPFIIAIVLLPALQKAKLGNRFSNELQRLKHNAQIFSALLEKQRPVITDPSGLGITLGNPDAAYKIIKVCSPYCGPCAEAHKPMEALLHHNSNIQLQILYATGSDEDNILKPPVKHFLAIAENNNEEIIKQALGDWYETKEKDYDMFAVKYPMNGELKKQDVKMEAMRNWCTKNEISYTPTIYISMPHDSGEVKYYEMPGVYSFDDLNYFFRA
ncbi:Uncharacterized membrane protein [Mucilaginibacter pineti]|uniref:Uncharacterized membrane protein n=1 Tax=Mucilaginibacter pineti TaxID=1391627 RepID=A0A1G7NG63_9SPHI|nr:vitamin K epoxide reductase family protein [Mucilaginibacter pineti]SDF72299.1 Uncharacterized membrane protein [Mucilaginibacter pineti]